MNLFRYLTPALLIWELLVALAILGVGLGTLRLLRRQSLPLGFALCTGVATWLLFGGILNLFAIATKPVLRTLVGVGVLLFLNELRDATLRHRFRAGLRRLWPSTNAARAVAGVLILWFGLCFVAHLASFSWNKFDDLQGYTAFAEKASALGSLQQDPFSERRITSGVGGALFFNVTMLSGAGTLSMDFVEGFLGLAAILLLLGALTRHFRLNTARTLAVFTAAAFFSLGRANISSVNFAAAIFLALLLLQLEPLYAGSSVVLTGLLVGAAFTLKSSNIPFCVLFLTFAAATQAWRRRSATPILQLLLSGLIAAVFILPWALKHRMDEATALFPSLGRGYHISAYGFPTILQTVPILKSFGAALPDLLGPLAAALLILWMFRKGSRPATPVLVFLFSAAIAAPIFSIAVGAEDIDRFFLPVFDICALIFCCGLLSAPASPRRSFAAAVLAVWAIVFLTFAVHENLFRDPGEIALLFGNRDPLLFYEIVRTPDDSAQARAALARAQAAIPAGAALLEEVQDAYAFDWHRNQVLLADYPGMASPPPGLPLDQGPAATRSFLLAHNVHYVIFDRSIDRTASPFVNYADFRLHPQVNPSWRSTLLGRHTGGYSRMENNISARTQQLFYDLATPPRIVFTEGPLTVIDLDKN